MIQVLKEGLITSTAMEETVVPMVFKDDGGYGVAGRHTFFFVLVSGSIQMSEGGPVINSGFTQTTHSTVGDKWFITCAPELKDGGVRNMRIVGAGTVEITW